MTKPSLRLLSIQDNADEAARLFAELSRSYTLHPRRVDSSTELVNALTTQTWDLVIADYAMPQLPASAALRYVRDNYPDLPFVVFSGFVGEDIAVEMLKQGADDLVIRGNWGTVTRRIQRVLSEAESHRKRRAAEDSLRAIMEQMPLLMWATDRDNRIVSLMGSCLSALKIEPEELVGRPLADLVGMDSPTVRLHELHVAELHGSEEDVDVQFLGRAFRAHIAPLHDPNGAVTGCLGVALDVTERKRAEEVAERSSSQLREISRRLIVAQEEERRKIASDLQEEIGQQLTGVKFTLDSAARLVSGQPGEYIAEAVQMIEELMGHVRQLSIDLRPSVLDDMGLIPALQSHFDAFSEQTGMRVDWGHNLTMRLSPSIETAAYRIIQEALTNAARYSGADNVAVALRVDGPDLQIEVRDHGCGADADSAMLSGRTVGIKQMRERAMLHGGRLLVASEPGEGTTIMATLPLPKLAVAEVPVATDAVAADATSLIKAEERTGTMN